MLPTNTMQYGSDVFNFQHRALLKANVPFDLTNETSCAGFEIGGTEPEGTARRIIFKIDDAYYKFGNTGLIEYEDRCEFEDIIQNGNTVAELLALQNIPDFAGKKIFPIIALSADESALVLPKIKMSLKVKSFNDIYTTTEYSPIYNLRDGAKIKELRSNVYTNGNATVKLYARVLDPVNGWTDYDFLPMFEKKLANKIQYKVVYALSSLDGSDFAAVNYIRCFYSTDSNVLAADSQEIITLAQDYYSDLKTAYLLVKHSEIVDAELKAYVNLSPLPVRRENISLGTSTGESQTLYLGVGGVVDKNIVADSIHLEIGGKTFTGFYFNTGNSSITLQADANKEITASYDCGLDNEDWRLMDLDFTRDEGGYFASRFIYRATDFEDKKVASIKIVIERLSGTVEMTNIGMGNGKLQFYALPHKAKAETLSASGAWKYDEEGQILSTTVAINNEVNTGYDWQGDLFKVYEYIAGFAVS